MGAKVVFVLAGYAIYAGLSRLLSPADFGVFIVVNSSVAVLNAVFVSGTIQAVSRFVALAPESAGGTIRSALRLQLILAGSVGGAYVTAAPLLATALGDDSLVPYLRISAVIPVAYAFYAALIGYANGRRWFGTQAGFDVAFSVLKLGLVVGLPSLGFGVLGAIAGFSAASILILGCAGLLIGRRALADEPSGGRSAKEIFQFEIFVIGHVALTNLLMQMDILMVKALYTGGDPNTAAGLYGSAAKLAQIPYSLLVALNFLIFPFITRATATAAPADARNYICEAFRVGLALVAGPAIVLSSIGTQTLALVFGPAYTPAAPALVVLATGYIAFSIFTMTSTVLNGAGRPGISLTIAASALSVQMLAGRVLIPDYGLEGAAVASAGSYLAGLFAGAAYLLRRFGNIVPWRTIGRVILSGGMVVVASRFVNDLSAVIAAVTLGATYLAGLLLLREWTMKDLRAVTGRRGELS